MLLTHLKQKKVWLPGVILVLLIAVFIVLRVSKPSMLPTISQPTTVPQSAETSINRDREGFPDVVRIEETLPESLRQNPKTKQIKSDGKTYIREQATIKQILIPDQSFLLTTPDNKEIKGLINDQTLLADAWFGYDKFDNLTNVQYTTITKADLQRIKEGMIVQIMYLQDSTVNQNIILTEFVLME